MADLEQWVNIDKDAKWEKPIGTTKARLGAIRLKVKFAKAVDANFDYEVLWDDCESDQATYNAKEEKRNLKFQLRNAIGSADNECKTEHELAADVSLPAAGGNYFKAKATHNGKTVESSNRAVTRRVLFYQTAAMPGTTHGNLAGMEKEFWAPRKYFLKLKEKARTPLKEVRCVWSNTKPAFRAGIKAAWKLEKLNPHAFMVCWCQYIARPMDFDPKLDLRKAKDKKQIAVNAGAKSVTISVSKYLWHLVDDKDPKTKDWLRSVAIVFVDSAGKTTVLAVPDKYVTHAGSKRFSEGGFHKVNLDLSDPSMKGRWDRINDASQKSIVFCLDLKIAVFLGGYANRADNVVRIATRSYWERSDEAKKLQILNHEFGHLIGMVSDGNGTLPDGPSTHYVRQDHKGPHCDKGMTWTAPAPGKTRGTWVGTPGCVMFGSTGGYDAAKKFNRTPQTFCGDCEPVVRKLDLSDSLSRMSGTPVGF